MYCLNYDNSIHKPPGPIGVRIEKVLPLQREYVSLDQTSSMPVAYEWSYIKEFWLIFCELVVYAGGATITLSS
jgi:hypothetical protein